MTKKWWLTIAVTGTCVALAVGWLAVVAGPSTSRPGQPEAAVNAAPAADDDSGNDTWMHQQAPNIWSRKLTEIVFPGSHDSATYGLGDPHVPLAGLAVTQTDDIAAQLNEGIREFDIRVEKHRWGSGPYAYYAHHGDPTSPLDAVSSWLTLGTMFDQIAAWATAPGGVHQDEVVLLNLSIYGGVPSDECKSFASKLGDALVTPAQLDDQLGKITDPGQVRLGDLWSLPNSKHAARVIMDNTDCLEAGLGTDVGSWGPISPAGQSLFSGYYADACNADQSEGIIEMVMAAAQERYTDGPGSEPIPWGPPKVGGMYVLGFQATPEADTCLMNPIDLLDEQEKALQYLGDNWEGFGGYKGLPALNVVSADFVGQSDLVNYVRYINGTFPGVGDAFARTGPQQVATNEGQTVSGFDVSVTYRGQPVTFEKVHYQVTPEVSNGPTFSGSGSEVDETTVGGAAQTSLEGGTPGTYTVTASIPGAGPVTWTLVVNPAGTYRLGPIGKPVAGVQAGGTLAAGQDSPDPLMVYAYHVLDGQSGGKLVPGVPVTFDAGEAGTWSTTGGTTVTVITDADGYATPPPLTATNTPGNFPVSMTSPGYQSASVTVMVTA